MGGGEEESSAVTCHSAGLCRLHLHLCGSPWFGFGAVATVVLSSPFSPSSPFLPLHSTFAGDCSLTGLNADNA